MRVYFLVAILFSECCCFFSPPFLFVFSFLGQFIFFYSFFYWLIRVLCIATSSSYRYHRGGIVVYLHTLSGVVNALVALYWDRFFLLSFFSCLVSSLFFLYIIHILYTRYTCILSSSYTQNMHAVPFWVPK